jgi:hypothetical protein
LPDKRERRKFAWKASETTLRALEEDRAVEAGFAEDGKRRPGWDKRIVDKEAS